MTPGKPDDSLVIGRRAHSRVFDRPIILRKAKEEDERVKRKLHKCLVEGRPEEFRAWLKRVRPGWEEDELAQYCMGMAFRAERRYDSAKRCFESALEKRRNLGDAMKTSAVLQQLGLIALACGDNEAVWKFYDEALEIMPDLWVTHFNRLCQASRDRDETKLRHVFHQLEANLPTWFHEKRLVEALKTDGELSFLREETQYLWQQISNQFQEETIQCKQR